MYQLQYVSEKTTVVCLFPFELDDDRIVLPLEAMTICTIGELDEYFKNCEESEARGHENKLKTKFKPAQYNRIKNTVEAYRQGLVKLNNYFETRYANCE